MMPLSEDTFEELAKFILGWWHRLSSLCKCLLKVDAALTSLRFQDHLYEEYQNDITQI
jgi:hypothetical protein